MLATRLSLGTTHFSTPTNALMGMPHDVLALNGHELDLPAEEAVTTRLTVAAGDVDEAGLSRWLAVWVDRES